MDYRIRLRSGYRLTNQASKREEESNVTLELRGCLMNILNKSSLFLLLQEVEAVWRNGRRTLAQYKSNCDSLEDAKALHIVGSNPATAPKSGS